ncbi:hypothetical protein FFK22_040405 [Mycobacterium sp. KBS0706]|uniref:hypothetical protein n=1 Tax=Mycobacterium sp. KBS0706 TaxID=2578109 RepID=UPI00110F92D3|nr:hypothetical protein [Mycobacterium sp. KBS0706]TSD82936.1 hypothetical protein FFK22_040405 [Mycobacterium sp. KBS0706]
MATTQSITSMPLDRLNGLLACWGAPDVMAGTVIETRVKRFRAAAADLQKSYGDVCDGQTDVLIATNAHSLQDACRSRHPRDVTAETAILAVVLDAIQLQAQIWTGLTYKILERCAALVSEPADERHAPAREERETTPPLGWLPAQDVGGQTAPLSLVQPEQSERRVSRRSSTRRTGGRIAAASQALDPAPDVDRATGCAEAAATVLSADGAANASGPDREAMPALGIGAEPANLSQPRPADSTRPGPQMWAISAIQAR